MLNAWHVNFRHSKDVQKQLMRTFVSRLSISSCLWSDVERAEFSLEKARDLSDLVGEASLDSFLAAVEQTHTDFDFPHDGLSFFLQSFEGMFCSFCRCSVKDVAAFKNWYSCPKPQIFRPHGLQTQSENHRVSCTQWQSHLTANFG